MATLMSHIVLKRNSTRLIMVRALSGKPNIFGNFVDKVKQGVADSKDLQENLKKLHEKKKQLADASANAKLKIEQEAAKARSKLELSETIFKNTEMTGKSESTIDIENKKNSTSSEATADKDQKTEGSKTNPIATIFRDIKAFFKKQKNDALLNSEFGKAAEKDFQQIKQGAQATAENISQKTKSMSGSTAAGKVKNVFQSLKNEFVDDSDMATKAQPYIAPVDRRRSVLEGGSNAGAQGKAIETDMETTGVVLHKDSLWQSKWNNFKDNNPVTEKLFDLRLKYEESNNLFIRLTRSATDNLREKIGDVFVEGESSQCLQEIKKMDPNFIKEKFLIHCERIVIPAVLEAYMAGDKDTLRDWCSDACYNFLCARIDERDRSGIKDNSRILDVRGVELLLSKIVDENPVLIMGFSAQQLKCVRDRSGAIIEGGEDHIERVMYVFAMRRKQDEFHPLRAWQLMEIGVQSTMSTW